MCYFAYRVGWIKCGPCPLSQMKTLHTHIAKKREPRQIQARKGNRANKAKVELLQGRGVKWPQLNDMELA
jgi:hypothetical protein